MTERFLWKQTHTHTFTTTNKNFFFLHHQQAFDVPIMFFVFIPKNAIHALHIRLETDTIQGIQAITWRRREAKNRLHLFCVIHSARLNEEHHVFYCYMISTPASLPLSVPLCAFFDFYDMKKKLHVKYINFEQQYFYYGLNF